MCERAQGQGSRDPGQLGSGPPCYQGVTRASISWMTNKNEPLRQVSESSSPPPIPPSPSVTSSPSDHRMNDRRDCLEWEGPSDVLSFSSHSRATDRTRTRVCYYSPCLSPCLSPPSPTPSHWGPAGQKPFVSLFIGQRLRIEGRGKGTGRGAVGCITP